MKSAISKSLPKERTNSARSLHQHCGLTVQRFAGAAMSPRWWSIFQSVRPIRMASIIGAETARKCKTSFTERTSSQAVDGTRLLSARAKAPHRFESDLVLQNRDHGGTGRRAALRSLWATIRVRVSVIAPCGCSLAGLKCRPVTAETAGSNPVSRANQWSLRMEKCQRCKKNEAAGPHRCPYQHDINDNSDEEYCRCCGDCEQDCRDDI